MADNLRLRVVLDLAERVLAPLKKISSGSSDAARALKAARDRLKELNQQQSQVGEFRTLRQNLQGTSDRLAQAQAKVNQLASAYRQAGPPTKAMATEMAGAKRVAAALGQQHDRQRLQVQQLRDKLEAAGISTSALGQHERRLRSDMAAATSAIDAQKSKLKALGEQHEKLAALKARHSRAMLHTGMVAGAGVAMQAVGRRGVEVGMAPVRNFAKHEDAMLGIARQVPGARNEIGQLTEVYRQAEQQVRDLSGQIPLATTQIAEMMTAAARMEVPTDKLKEFTLLASQMATAFDAVPDEITESMGKVAKNFKIPLTDIRGLADSINYLDDNAISKGSDIVDYLNRVSGVAALAKMSAQDYAALGSTLLTTGERTESAATATNAIITKLAAATKGTKKFQGAMKEMGLSSAMVQKGMATDAMSTLSTVLDAVRKLPEEKRLGVMVELVGMEHSDTLAKLVSNPEELTRQRKLANGGEAKGSMEREAAARNATLSAQWQMARNRAFNLSAAAGDSLKPALIELLQAVNPLIDKFGRWVQANPGLVSGVMKVVLAVSAAIAVMGALLVPLALIIGKVLLTRFLFSRLALGMLSMGSAAGAAGLGMGLLYRLGYAAGRVFAWLRPILGYVGQAVLWLGRLLLANPLFLALGLLATAAYLVWKNWDGIKGGLQAIWQSLGGSVSAALATMGAFILNWSPLGLFHRAFAGVMSWFGVELPGKFTEFGANLISGLVNGITSGWARLREAVASTATSVSSWFKDKLGINRPSRVFMEYGGWISEGAALGIAGGQGAVRAAALAMAGAATAAMPLAADAAALRLDTRPAIGSAGQKAAPAAGNATYTITINAAPGMDPQAIARAVSSELDRRERASRSRVLSQLGDID